MQKNSIIKRFVYNFIICYLLRLTDGNTIINLPFKSVNQSNLNFQNYKNKAKLSVELCFIINYKMKCLNYSLNINNDSSEFICVSQPNNNISTLEIDNDKYQVNIQQLNINTSNKCKELKDDFGLYGQISLTNRPKSLIYQIFTKNYFAKISFIDNENGNITLSDREIEVQNNLNFTSIIKYENNNIIFNSTLKNYSIDLFDYLLDENFDESLIFCLDYSSHYSYFSNKINFLYNMGNYLSSYHANVTLYHDDNINYLSLDQYNILNNTSLESVLYFDSNNNMTLNITDLCHKIKNKDYIFGIFETSNSLTSTIGQNILKNYISVFDFENNVIFLYDSKKEIIWTIDDFLTDKGNFIDYIINFSIVIGFVVIIYLFFCWYNNKNLVNNSNHKEKFEFERYKNSIGSKKIIKSNELLDIIEKDESEEDEKD